MNIITPNIDVSPYTDVRNVTGKVRVKTHEEASWLDNFFNGTEHYDQVTGITRGKRLTNLNNNFRKENDRIMNPNLHIRNNIICANNHKIIQVQHMDTIIDTEHANEKPKTAQTIKGFLTRLFCTALLICICFTCNTTTVEAASKKGLTVSKTASTIYVKGNAKHKSNITVKWNGKKVTNSKAKFVSSNKKVATVNKNGVIVAKKAGKTKISVRYKGKTKAFTVKVVKCSHNWVNHTATRNVNKTVHHDAEYKTVHHDAVVMGYAQCACPGCRCGKVFYGERALEDLMDHCWEVTGTLNVQCATGEETVQEAYDEQVLVKDAWDETVTTKQKFYR